MADVRTILEVLLEISNGAIAALESLVCEGAHEMQSSIRSAAFLAVTVADAAAPFTVDLDPQSAAIALSTLSTALQILAIVNSQPQDESNKPLPQLLPHVHAHWPSIVSPLARGHPAASRVALQVIPIVALMSGGDFVRARVSSDLWPALRVMLSPANENARMRLAALNCLAELAGADSTRSALAGILREAAASVIGVLQRPLPDAALQALATSTLVSLSLLDCDAVFFLECCAGRRRPGSPPGDTSLFSPLVV